MKGLMRKIPLASPAWDLYFYSHQAPQELGSSHGNQINSFLLLRMQMLTGFKTFQKFTCRGEKAFTISMPFQTDIEIKFLFKKKK